MATKQTGKSIRFDYTGNMQEFIVPVTGLYKLEVWGASGGTGGSGIGGLGGYSCKYIDLASGDKLYICCGGSGANYEDLSEDNEWCSNGGYNGGGCSVKCPSGGGATHIARTNRGFLYNYESYKDEVIVVAGGGGGGGSSVTGDERGGHGGGLTGTSYNMDMYAPFYAGAGTQDEPGQNGYWTDDDDYPNGGYWTGGSGLFEGKFGGGSQVLSQYEHWHSNMDEEYGVDGLWGAFLHGWTGGGGGWYGGAGGTNYNGCIGAGGGSGYIGTPSIVYEGITYENTTQAGMNNGNGSALITPMQSTAPSVYLGTQALSSIYFGTHEITDIKFHDQ